MITKSCLSRRFRDFPPYSADSTDSALNLFPNFIDSMANDRAAKGSSNAGEKPKERFVNLRPVRFHSQQQISQHLDNGNKNAHHQSPTPGTPWPQNAQRHGGDKDKDCCQQQVSDFDVKYSGGDAEETTQ